jgi:hypothetical protein
MNRDRQHSNANNLLILGRFINIYLFIHYTSTTGILTIAHCLWYTRWFKYDRDYLCINKSQFVLVIFQPPCNLDITNETSITFPPHEMDDVQLNIGTINQSL